MATAIEFNHVGKQYRLGLVSTKTLSHDLNRWWQTSVLKKEDPYLKIGEANDRTIAGNSEYVWALRDIDFKIEQGDVVGIIGKNGAGKSTLLKLLSRVTGPTVGSIRARGRIGALLEVGTGFHPEMTGRENIYMNGAIMGMSRAEVSRKLDEIIGFSGCERYIDTPVKRYSSGMTVRLGFAVAAHLDPEILVVDEVLAVGDAEFQKKAIGKMQDVSRGEGRTVLFVSHNMANIKNLCRHGILLENGAVVKSGEIDDVVNYYLQGTLAHQNENLLSRQDRNGNGKVRLENVLFYNQYRQRVDHVISGEGCVISVIVRNFRWERQDLVDQFTIAVNDRFGDRALVMSNTFIGREIYINSEKERTVVNFSLDKCPFNAGEYGMAFFLSDKSGNVVDWIDNVATFRVTAGDYYHLGQVIRSGLGCFLTDFDVKNE